MTRVVSQTPTGELALGARLRVEIFQELDGRKRLQRSFPVTCCGYHGLRHRAIHDLIDCVN